MGDTLDLNMVWGPHKRKVLKTLYRLQSGLCYLCGRAARLDNAGAEDKATIEHVWPKSLAHECHGPVTLMACNRCNTIKADDLPDKSELQLAQVVHWVADNEKNMTHTGRKAALGLISSMILAQYESPTNTQGEK